jgi:probable rRNA maturation factor
MSPERSCVLFENPSRGVGRRGLRAFAETLRSEVAGGRPFCCLVADDRELRRLNRRFRKQDYATDVLSFPAAVRDGSLGEIAISIERAREQAGELGHGVEEELRILMLHGVLHLLGLDHERDGGEMARVERRWRRKLGLPAGLIERAAS